MLISQVKAPLGMNKPRMPIGFLRIFLQGWLLGPVRLLGQRTLGRLKRFFVGPKAVELAKNHTDIT